MLLIIAAGARDPERQGGRVPGEGAVTASHHQPHAAPGGGLQALCVHAQRRPLHCASKPHLPPRHQPL